MPIPLRAGQPVRGEYAPDLEIMGATPNQKLLAWVRFLAWWCDR